MTDGQRYSVTQNLMLPLCLIDQMLMRCRCCERVVAVCVFGLKLGTTGQLLGPDLMDLTRSTLSNGQEKWGSNGLGKIVFWLGF